MTEEQATYGPEGGDAASKQRLTLRTLARRARDEQLLVVGKLIYQQHLRRGRATSGIAELDAALAKADAACEQLAQLD